MNNEVHDVIKTQIASLKQMHGILKFQILNNLDQIEKTLEKKKNGSDSNEDPSNLIREMAKNPILRQMGRIESIITSLEQVVSKIQIH